MDGSSWMMLDHFVFHRDDEEEVSPFLDESKAPLRASSCTSLCKTFDNLFLPAAPLAISCFYMKWPGGTKLEDSNGTELVAANRDLFLFRQTSFVRLGNDSRLPITQDHFICIVSYETKMSLQLKRLPVCNKPMIFLFGEGEEKAVREKRVFLPDNVGLTREAMAKALKRDLQWHSWLWSAKYLARSRWKQKFVCSAHLYLIMMVMANGM